VLGKIALVEVVVSGSRPFDVVAAAARDRSFRLNGEGILDIAYRPSAPVKFDRQSFDFSVRPETPFVTGPNHDPRTISRFRDFLSICGEVGSLAGVGWFRMSDPDRPTPLDDKSSGRDARGLILRITVVVLLSLLSWHVVLVSARP
jgi:hypothetical protein